MKFWLDVDGALLRQAAALADPIRKALVASIDVEDVLDQWERTYPEGTPITRIEGRQWAKATVDVDEQPLIDVMGDVYATGFVMGDLVATASYGHESMKTKAGNTKPQPPSPELIDIAISVDWSKWKPGNKPAQALMSPKGALRKLLKSRKKLVDDVSMTTVNSIGNILATGLGAGTNRFDLAAQIDAYLDNPSRSLMISTTELTRGMQTTALEQFKEFGNKVRWLALDPCEFCAGNAAEGTVSPGYEYKDVNGSVIYNPPAHPHCRCALTPVVDLNPDIPSLDLALSAALLKYSDAQARDERGRWSSGVSGGGKFKDYSKNPDQFYKDNEANQSEMLYANTTYQQRQALNGYQNAGYESVNGSLRGTEQVAPENQPALQTNIDSLDATINAAPPLAQDTLLFRGLRNAETAAALQVGTIVTDKGFTSTTASTEYARGWASPNNGGYVMAIQAPAGTKGVIPHWATMNEDFKNEYEFLLPRNTSLQITNINHDARTIEAQIVNR
jgi:hypothetical protein